MRVGRTELTVKVRLRRWPKPHCVQRVPAGGPFCDKKPLVDTWAGWVCAEHWQALLDAQEAATRADSPSSALSGPGSGCV